jgi:DNA-binding MarR family transcriptional regulator
VTELTQTTWTPLPALLDDFAEQCFEEFRERLDAAGHSSIRAGHGCVFRFIHQGGSRLTDLACSSGLTKQAVGEVVDNLERLGYVDRQPDPADRRAKVISLTEAGADAQQTALAIFSDIEQRLGERYGKERIEALRSLLEDISADRIAAGRADAA